MLKRSTSLSPAPSAPHDERLPGGNRLVDRSFLIDTVRRLAGRDDGDLSIDGVRYKPGARLVVVASLIVDGRHVSRAVVRSYPAGECRAAVAKVKAFDPDASVVHDPTTSWFAVDATVDYELPGLRELTGDRAGAGYLRRLVPELARPDTRLRSKTFGVKTLRLKPGRHAVLELFGRIRNDATRVKRPGRWIARVVPPTSTAPGPAVTGGVTPQRLAWDAHRGIAIEEWRSGVPLRDVESPDWEAVAAAIAALHVSDEPPAAPSPSAVDGAIEHLAWLSPILADRARTVVGRAAEPTATTLVHGDLHVGQVLSNDRTVSIVDLATARAGRPEVDLADLLLSLVATGREPSVALDLWRAYARLRDIDDRVALEAASRRAIEAAAAPIRNLHPDRADLSARWVDAAEALIRAGDLISGFAKLQIATRQ